MFAALCVARATSAMADDRVNAAMQEHGAGPRQRLFDIPSQKLASALESYGAISGFQVVYDATLARGRQSAEVKGMLTPEMGLRRLLAGTGLAARYMAADGVVLEPDQQVGGEGKAAPPGAVTRYYGRIQAGLRQVLCGDTAFAAAPHSVAVGLWIAPSGRVARSALLDTTGDADRDASLEAVIRRMSIDEPPPDGFAQPVIMMLSPDTHNDCALAPRQRAAR